MDTKTIIFAAVAAAGLYVYMFKDSVVEGLESYKDDLTFTTIDESIIEYLKSWDKEAAVKKTDTTVKAA